MVFYPAGGKKGKRAAAALLSAVYLMTLAPLAQAETVEEQRDAHIEKAEQAQKKKNEIESRIEGLSEEKRGRNLMRPRSASMRTKISSRY